MQHVVNTYICKVTISFNKCVHTIAILYDILQWNGILQLWNINFFALSLSTLVLNSRGQHETNWQLNFACLKTHLEISYT